MKMGSLLNFLIIVFITACILFIHVATVSEIKNLKKEKMNKIEILNEKNNRIELRLVEKQKLMTEERIVKLAKDSLGLILPTEQIETLRVSKELVKRIETLVKGKYD